MLKCEPKSSLFGHTSANLASTYIAAQYGIFVIPNKRLRYLAFNAIEIGYFTGSNRDPREKIQAV